MGSAQSQQLPVQFVKVGLAGGSAFWDVIGFELVGSGLQVVLYSRETELSVDHGESNPITRLQKLWIVLHHALKPS